MSVAQQRVNGVQDDMLPFGAPQRAASGPVVEHTASEVLCRVLIRSRHQVRDRVVVADAGMLSAANLNALEDAGHPFIVGSRQSNDRRTRRVV